MMWGAQDTVPAAATRLTPVSATADARGLAAASTAFVIWGVLPLYLKQLQYVPALQITAHRLVWGCLFGVVLLGVRGELTRVHSPFAEHVCALALVRQCRARFRQLADLRVCDRQSLRRRIQSRFVSPHEGRRGPACGSNRWLAAAIRCP